MIVMLLITILQSACAFFIGTILADAAHYFFHYCAKSHSKILHQLGKLHLIHHRFYTSHLQIEMNLAAQNFWQHLLIEYFFQLFGILICLFIFPVAAIVIAVILQTFIFLLACYWRGVDLHHRPYTQLPAYHGGALVDANYHALHHIYPRAFFSSYIKIFDYVFGTGHYLTDKRIAMTGANGALGKNMKILLEKEGAIISSFQFGKDYTYDNYEGLVETLKQTDILFLCHGTKSEHTQEANCDSFVKIIELYKTVRPKTLRPVEIWAVGSEIECHPCFGIKKLYPYASSKRNFAKHAHQYFKERDIQYRHLVHSAFTSPMGPGLMSAKFAAWMTMFFRLYPK